MTFNIFLFILNIVLAIINAINAHKEDNEQAKYGWCAAALGWLCALLGEFK